MSRREPERTCVGCRRTGSKAELLRVVRPAGGIVAVDPTGRAQGRGAYVHLAEGCAQRAVRSGGLARALRAPLSGAEAARLLEELRAELGIPTGEPAPEGEEP